MVMIVNPENEKDKTMVSIAKGKRVSIEAYVAK